MLRRAALLAILLAASSARAEPDAGLPQQAFMLQMQIGAASAVPIYNGQGTISASGFSVLPALVVGARLMGRLELGVGLSFVRFFNGPAAFNNPAFNVIAFTPTVAVDLVRSRDRKVDLYAKVGLPLAAVVVTQGPTTDNGFGVGFQLAAGVRYALHPMFALGMEGGAYGQFVNPQRALNSAFANFYGSLTGTFFFGGNAK